MYTDKRFENINEIIQDIQDKATELQNSPKIHEIELDILLERVRNLYENIKDLEKEQPGKITTKQEKKEDAEKTRTIEFKIGEEEQNAEKEEIKKKEKTEPEKSEEQNKITRNQTTEAKQDLQEEQKPEEKTDEWHESAEVTKRQDYEPEIVADKYQNARTFRNETLAKSQSKNDVSSKMQAKPIQDLIKAIGVNDKFLFIKELFEGNKDQYHEAIQILNEMPSLEEAETYLQESFDFDWNDPVFKKFHSLIKRKFM
ncbi:MAG: hypothetical protein ACLFPH_05100 [Bacteroidales bacterium]